MFGLFQLLKRRTNISITIRRLPLKGELAMLAPFLID